MTVGGGLSTAGLKSHNSAIRYRAPIDEDFEEARQEEEQTDHDKMYAATFRDACRVDSNRQNVAHDIDGAVALGALRLLAASVAALPPFCTVFTDWLSRIASVGSGLRPALTRTR